MAKAIIKSDVEFVMGVRNMLVAVTRNPESAKVFESEAAAREWLADHLGAGYGFNGAGFNVVVKEA
uniref:Uncharacterized protein n=1 Tax=Pseudomonas phage Cygsa01 TaxID=3138529 RepID=A0AAU6W489_9VIRU